MFEERIRIQQAIQSVVHPSANADLLEKYIYEFAKDKDEYLTLTYSCLCRYQMSTEKKSLTLKSILQDIFHNKTHWKGDAYRIFQQQLEEEDAFRLCPIEIEEGVLECKCGSKRTISFQRQTRSADEGSTTFAQCVECGAKWRHNN